MAGAGYKSFATGDVLTASDVNTYLMQQSVMVFADAAARTAAISSPSEGMMSYLKDTNKTYRYDGSAWLDDAGTTSPLTTKGDLWTYTTTDARLASSGVNNDVLTVDTSTASGLKWAAPVSGGMTSIASGTLSGSTVDIQNIPTTYNDLVLYIRNPYVSSGASLGYIQIRVNGQTSSYYAWNGQASSTNFNNNGTTAWNLWDGTNNYISNSTTDRAGIYFRLFDYASTTSQKTTQFNLAASNAINNTNGNGVLNQSYSTTAITSLQILTSFSTFAGGTYNLYGVK